MEHHLMAASHYILGVNFSFSKSFKALTKNLPWRLFIPFLKYQVMKTLKHSLRTLKHSDNKAGLRHVIFISQVK